MLARPPILYSFRRCPYAMRARLALQVAQIECELREVKLANKPPQMLAVSEKATVPVLVMATGEVIDQSLDIMTWALAHNDPQQWLTPTGVTSAQLFDLIARFDREFKDHLDRYKYATRYPGVDRLKHRAGAAHMLAELERLLARHEYLAGGHESLVDIAIAPFIRQFAHTDLPWFLAQTWPSLILWLQRFTESEAFRGVMFKMPPWRDGDPPQSVFGRHGLMPESAPESGRGA